jgi:hypothetical protein
MENQVKIQALADQKEKALPVCHNSYVTIRNKELDIHYRNQRYRVSLDKIDKFYLQIKIINTWIPGIQRFLTPKYTLCLQTCDCEKVTMIIRASDKQYFVNAISTVRHINQKNKEPLYLEKQILN